MTSTPRMPVIYLGHGAPPLADDARWTAELAAWSAELPAPQSILVVSAHWEAAPLTVAATTPVPLVYDFWGFPQHYYDVRYDAPGAPELAASVHSLLGGPGTEVHDAPDRGLDHGAYVPLVEMYPGADVPVLQLSMPTLDPAALYDVGRRLAPLREQGVLVMGSGFLTHNLSLVDLAGPAAGTAPAWSAEFDDWATGQVLGGAVDDVLDFSHKAPAARIAHPRTEHLAPLFVALGAAGGDDARSVIDGYWYGMAKRSFQFG
jgi:4,5-DOPA dioxygenase extradiol